MFEGNLQVALDLARDCGNAYASAVPALRRQWNQAFFTRVEVDDDRVMAAEMASPFDVVLQPEVIQYYGRATPEPLWTVGEAIKDVLSRWDLKTKPAPFWLAPVRT